MIYLIVSLSFISALGFLGYQSNKRLAALRSSPAKAIKRFPLTERARVYIAKKRRDGLRKASNEPLVFTHRNAMRHTNGAIPVADLETEIIEIHESEAEKLRNPWLKNLDTSKRDILRALVHEKILEAKENNLNSSPVC